jgi:hypothetical protein
VAGDSRVAGDLCYRGQARRAVDSRANRTELNAPSPGQARTPGNRRAALIEPFRFDPNFQKRENPDKPEPQVSIGQPAIDALEGESYRLEHYQNTVGRHPRSNQWPGLQAFLESSGVGVLVVITHGAAALVGTRMVASLVLDSYNSLKLAEEAKKNFLAAHKDWGGNELAVGEANVTPGWAIPGKTMNEPKVAGVLAITQDGIAKHWKGDHSLSSI